MSFLKNQIIQALIIFLMMFACHQVMAQQAMEQRSRSGVTFSLGGNLPTTIDYSLPTKKSLVASVGYLYEYSISNKLSISTGIELEYLNLKYSKGSGDTDSNFLYFSNQYHNHESGSAHVFTGSQYSEMDEDQTGFSILQSRNQKGVILSLPIQLQLMSRFYKYIRFTGKLGFRNNLNLFNRAVDQAEVGEVGYVYQTYSKKYVMKTRDMHLAYTNLVFGGGIEWNYSGSSSFRVELEYNFNITPIYKKSYLDGHLYNSSGLNWSSDFLPTSPEEIFTNDIRLHQLKLKLGLIF